MQSLLIKHIQHLQVFLLGTIQYNANIQELLAVDPGHNAYNGIFK